jgi:chromatin remodeling complex protein RSC6
MPTKASKEPKAAKETKAPKQTKAPKAAKASKEKGGKAEPASAGGQKPNALQQPLQPSKELAAVVGSGPLPRGEVVSKFWDYIKGRKAQLCGNVR